MLLVARETRSFNKHIFRRNTEITLVLWFGITSFGAIWLFRIVMWLQLELRKAFTNLENYKSILPNGLLFKPGPVIQVHLMYVYSRSHVLARKSKEWMVLNLGTRSVLRNLAANQHKGRNRVVVFLSNRFKKAHDV